MDEKISHPSHYTRGGMECIDEMIMVFGKDAVATFCLLNVWKYRYRLLDKGGELDFEKSNDYMRIYKRLLEED